MNKGSIICVLLVLAFAWDYTEAARAGVTITLSKCTNSCVPPGCKCNIPPIPSSHYHKLCLDGTQTQCPLNVCSVPVVEPCLKLRERVTHKKRRAPRTIKDLHRSKRSNKRVIFEEVEVEFCERSKRGKKPNCFPVCTKDVTSLCVALAYK